MAGKIDWESRIGRRVKLRDLHVYFAVVQCGSMARAAAQLGVSQPTVSELITDLEHAFGVRLLDRIPRGVEPTVYGKALLKRSMVAFDELRQSVNDIEFLADPTVGEVRIGCPESVSSGILRPIIQKFTLQYPRAVLHVHDVIMMPLESPALNERRLDLVFTRLMNPLGVEPVDDSLNVEILFNDELVIATAARSRWSARRRIDIADLAHESWVLTGPDTWAYKTVADAFRERRLGIPKMRLVTFSTHLRANLLADTAAISAFPKSFLRVNADRFSLKALPIVLPSRPWPVAMVTLKHRILSPVVERFIECTREVTKSFAGGLRS